jgi:hypothetical protein
MSLWARLGSLRNTPVRIGPEQVKRLFQQRNQATQTQHYARQQALQARCCVGPIAGSLSSCQISVHAGRLAHQRA